jgi:hypothetical protein
MRPNGFLSADQVRSSHALAYDLQPAALSPFDGNLRENRQHFIEGVRETAVEPTHAGWKREFERARLPRVSCVGGLLVERYFHRHRHRPVPRLPHEFVFCGGRRVFSQIVELDRLEAHGAAILHRSGNSPHGYRPASLRKVHAVDERGRSFGVEGNDMLFLAERAKDDVRRRERYANEGHGRLRV